MAGARIEIRAQEKRDKKLAAKLADAKIRFQESGKDTERLSLSMTTPGKLVCSYKKGTPKRLCWVGTMWHTHGAVLHKPTTLNTPRTIVRRNIYSR